MKKSRFSEEKIIAVLKQAEAGVKVFLDRISDYLDLPDLLDDGRRLRGKRAYVVCTSIYDEAPVSAQRMRRG